MIGEFAAAIIIIIHRGEVVVDKGIGVDALNGARQGHGLSLGTTTGCGGGKAKSGAHAFAAGKQRVAHGLVNRCRTGAGRRQKVVEGAVNGLGALLEEAVQIERVIGTALEMV
jgi:hypothetical protein